MTGAASKELTWELTKELTKQVIIEIKAGMAVVVLNIIGWHSTSLGGIQHQWVAFRRHRWVAVQRHHWVAVWRHHWVAIQVGNDVFANRRTQKYI